MNNTVMISVAHSSAAKGAASLGGLPMEYDVSMRASIAAMRSLMGEFPMVLFDCGPLPQKQYDDAKILAVNTIKPKLALEIHCNASDNPFAMYGEVLHHRDSLVGRRAAQCISDALLLGFLKDHPKWKQKGPRANSVAQDKHLMFFLEHTSVPCVIVEGIFISSVEQSRWLVETDGDHGGPEAYGLLVAAGIRRFMATQI